jgi:hypothetical protein
VAALGAAAVIERASITASLAVLGHLHWLWIPAAIAAEAASMAAFAFMLRRLLAAGGARVGVRPMLATAFAANALSVSIPLAGPELATAFSFRRFTRQGADAPLAGQGDAQANAVNDNGVIVGTGGNGHAFIDQNGQATDLNNLIGPASGVTLTAADGINDNGVIVGTAVSNANPRQTFGFELTPVG